MKRLQISFSLPIDQITPKYVLRLPGQTAVFPVSEATVARDWIMASRGRHI
jgi:hypothetical protein